MFVAEAGVNSMYYVYTDHLGSINTITNDAGAVVYEQAFDAWGRNRNVNDWTYDAVTPPPNWLWRGFTGHEHLPDYDLIDMNGRVYDPIVSQFVSVDPMLNSYPGQSPYNYAMNNPMSNTDPSGLGVENKVLFDLDNDLQTYIEDANGTDYITYNYGHYKDGGFITDYSYTQEQYMALISKNKVPVQDVTSESDINKSRALWRQTGQNFKDMADFGEKFVIASFAVPTIAVGGFAVAAEYGIFAAGATTATELKIGSKLINAGTKGSSKLYSQSTFKAFERQLASDGIGSILRTQTKIQRNLAEHIKKLGDIKNAGGYSSSVEREIRTFQAQLDAIKDLLK